MLAKTCLTHDGEIKNEAAKKASRRVEPWNAHSHRPDGLRRPVHLHARRLHRLRDHRPRAGDPAHAADVGLATSCTASSWSARCTRCSMPTSTLEQVIGFVGVLLGAGNAAGGYVVTERMLEMFKSSDKKKAGSSMSAMNAQLLIDSQLPRRRVPVHLRPEAHVLAGDGALRHRRRRLRHAGRGARQLPLLLRRQRRGQAAPQHQRRARGRSRWRIGVGWAWWSGKRVAMTAMPQMVALYNGMGGGSAAAIAAMELLQPAGRGVDARLVHYAGHGGRRADRRGLAVRFADRLGQARRPHQQALRMHRPAGVQRRGDAGHARRSAATSCSCAHGHAPCRVIVAFFVVRAAVRRADDDADRRRRHAGGDLAVQRLHRAWRSASKATCCRTRR